MADPLRHADPDQPRCARRSAASTSASTSRAAPPGRCRWRTARAPRSPTCATSLDPLGFNDAKVSTLLGDGGRQRPGPGRDHRRPDPTIQQTLADDVEPRSADVLFVRNDDRQRHVHVQPRQRTVTPTDAGVEKALTDTGLTNPTVTVDGQNVTVTVAKLPTESSSQTVAAAARRSTRASTSARSASRTVGPTWGDEVSQQGAAGARHLLLRARALPDGPVRVADGGRRDRRGGPRHHHQRRRVLALPVQVTPATVTAFLTILGFSLYDTIVVFDKVTRTRRTLTRDRAVDLRRDGEPVAEPGADAVADHDARRAAPGACRC